jgi:hypothetical protein
MILCVLVGCSRLAKEESQFIGEWKFFRKEADFDEAMLAYVEASDFVLQENGSWSIGNSKGKWGTNGEEVKWSVLNDGMSAEEEYKSLDLHFTDYEIEISNHANQFNRVEGSICVFDDVQVLKISVAYEYDQNNFYQTKYGKVDSYTTKAHSSVSYYFIRKDRFDEDYKKMVAYKMKKDKIREINTYAYKVRNEYITDPVDWFRSEFQKDSTCLDKYLAGLEHNIKIERSNDEQKLLLAWIYLTKLDYNKATEIAKTINYETPDDSIKVNTILVARDLMNRDISNSQEFNKRFKVNMVKSYLRHMAERDTSKLEMISDYEFFVESIPENLKIYY